jgi:O-acetyl-ADP-ribose deacetylase (regulator of RNase III)
MSSKALYLQRVNPSILYRYQSPQKNRRSIEIWKTPCIVSKFGKQSDANCSILVNPANPQLSGVTQFPYFPRGGPVPKTPPRISAHHIMGYVTEWGGMDVGNGMLFPVSVIDGLVHLHGGWKLQAECKWLYMKHGGEPCPVGSAVRTSAGNGTLAVHYDTIIHTTPPFYQYHEEPERRLGECYQSALEMAFAQQKGICRVAIPLLGAGARGFPVEVAVRVAGENVWNWCNQRDTLSSNHDEQVVAMGVLENTVAEELINVLSFMDSNDGNGQS